MKLSAPLWELNPGPQMEEVVGSSPTHTPAHTPCVQKQPAKDTNCGFGSTATSGSTN